MNLKPELIAQVDDEGRVVFPLDITTRYGLAPGARVRIDENGNGLHLRRSITQLSKVYVEPTNHCNLTCRTCMRNVWDEPLGIMSDAVFVRVIEGLRACSPPPTVFFGGFGEPLFHPKIVEMVSRVKALGASVELITNGMLLDQNLAPQLINAGLDVLWVSLDGATPESYADVRLGATLPEVIQNLTRLRDLRIRSRFKLQLGIAFVAMKRNITDLPAVLRLGRRLGAERFLVTNVLPHTREMIADVLYSRALSDVAELPSPFGSRLDLPRIDWNEDTREPLYQAWRSWYRMTSGGTNLGAALDFCPFVENGATAISWDGSLSPCLPLMHSHMTFLDEREHFSRRYVVGNVTEHDLAELWNDAQYAAFRERVQVFDFAPCLSCGGCDYFEANEEDCFGNTFPTCSGCLWAQGLIQCP
jgi:MoaA/NifB/PqqE/SkfB family radical SAM enzyme